MFKEGENATLELQVAKRPLGWRASPPVPMEGIIEVCKDATFFQN
jgi:hypothetical protein